VRGGSNTRAFLLCPEVEFMNSIKTLGFWGKSQAFLCPVESQGFYPRFPPLTVAIHEKPRLFGSQIFLSLDWVLKFQGTTLEFC